MPVFSGIWVALVTPFNDGAIDFPALRRLARHLLGEGVAGLVACGTTGEAAALSKVEQLAVLDTLLEEVPGDRLVMGMAGNNLAEVLEFQSEVQRRPIAGVLVPAPYYIRPSQDGLLAWFGAIADASTVPVILYDIPYRTGVRMELATLRQLARHPRVAAIKDCGGNPETTQALIADGELDVLTGEDGQIFTTLCMGGRGAICASAHIHPRQFVHMAECIGKGELEAARAIFQKLQPLIRLAFAEPNPAPVKSLLAIQGLIQDELRLPMQRSSEALRQRLGAELA
ncbi:4-hydroxy-tetrahydrodipicolinate synthase [Pseudomonas sp. JS3066]|jgi:4-hydroxy-tetrahydrodipicolinate synthase|uniref:4-hydroxy-tetrahydrodipicolinate synthase n=1 Tax=unclassified Pseudomonas TaxID=196821 RepID=UPI000EA9985E|nr:MULTISPECIES: 4-hydroxy-tetrahydrodipicolinate synthase [unclassified Pseudomonas]AYF87613.1 4-hydroxy-tetrahydrodipicolinate synthase [Pseudomonas sp. DY-1]MDH4656444.1 4-hydroxy-tetrahydrodipicolinate synthase [Pseudomonas sp. BN606]MRK20143.1 4-hydroxy-tetrahydrodipicolinate synthase [Pseudomonas sp. JG-B]WVK94876.1 4-hydroxy-tetrahydrodipicolinate synthase [Pseudomonas sp. JS3066]